MAGVVVDSNVILDVVNEDPTWFEWSARQLECLAETFILIVNPIIYSEVSIGFDRIEDLDRVLSEEFFRREPLPWEAAFLRASASSSIADPAARAVHRCRTSILVRMPLSADTLCSPVTRGVTRRTFHA